MSKPAVTNLPCDSCRRPIAKRRTFEGFIFDACDECMKSEFRIGRMREGAKERAL